MPRDTFRDKPERTLIETGVFILVLTLSILILARLAGAALDKWYDVTWLGVTLIS